MDRDGNVLNYSESVGGERQYNGGRAYSTLTGYYSNTYGTLGVEKSYNVELASSHSLGDSKRGHDVTLTTDSDLQQAAYDAISNISNGAAVVLDARTAEILAMASTPTFDPATVDSDWEELCSIDGLFYPNAYRNTFAPGSVFKVISACAVLDNNVSGQPVEDNGYIDFPSGHRITNYTSNAYGTLYLEDAIVYSSNVYFMEKAMEMGGQKLEDSIRKFLIGENIKLDFTTLKSTLKFDDYSDETISVTAFGQGQTEVSPLQMAMVTQAIANDGVMLKPYLIKSVKSANGTTTAKGETEELATTTTPKTAKRVTDAMTLAAEAYGFDYIGPEGWDVAAKTGTAETGKGTYHGWIVSFAPSEQPKYVVVVLAASQDHDGIYYKSSVDQIYSALVDYDQNRSDSYNSDEDYD